MNTFYTYTALNGNKLKVNVDHIQEAGPHIEGGSFIVINGAAIRIQEDIKDLWKSKEQI